MTMRPQIQPIPNAPNGFELSFEPELLQPIQALYQQEVEAYVQAPEQLALLKGGRRVRQITRSPHFYLVSYGEFPLLWFGNHTEAAYRIFERFYQRLELQRLMAGQIDFKQRLVMFSGFFVVGCWAPYESWHFDYRPGAQAYTVILPLFDLDAEHGHLQYKDCDHQTQIYRYQKGRAVVFGHGFEHCTQPYAFHDRLRVLYSFTFGSDKPQYWPVIQPSIDGVSQYYHLPCGHRVNSCRCMPHKAWP